MDAASSAAWVAAALSAASALFAAKQARHAKRAADGTLRQAESTYRQALAAEEVLLLQKLEISAGGDREQALLLLAGRVRAVEYLQTAQDFLDLLVRSTRWGIPGNLAEERLQTLWVSMMVKREQHKSYEQEPNVTQLVNRVDADIQSLKVHDWFDSPCET